MATRPILVTTLSRKTPFFDDETRSRHHFETENAFFDDETYSRHLFETENALFRRRNLFSSPFCGEKLHILTTRLVLVTILSRKTSYFGDETYSRHHFKLKNTFFWRRDPFSSPF
ncbi:hypothetical protein LIZ76_15505 [Caldibacillus sp. 210928-DFI.2.22]|uniref:hypothetical protein n=1 Tax=Caldibacillus sp. 210928-DFI.2.18 TaxID=2883264 RepID=UPI001D062CA4|nr:hypothetical protein [Caldibacillus sp. 210928-DFI.2.18]MCB7071337.1 hypothetical protein [Caldibacillus sp. 210928-DFI.2.22]MCB7074793.1 hypothetical protein [Caldibacillus sp. 210928-DFI.2.18]